jgi:hypothetical protein
VRDHEEIVELLALLTDGRPEAIWRAENYRISGTAVPPAPKPQPCAGCAALREALQRIYDHALFIDNDAAEYWQRVIKSTLAPSQPDGEQP